MFKIPESKKRKLPGLCFFQLFKPGAKVVKKAFAYTLLT
jgi:hypothetical protein